MLQTHCADPDSCSYTKRGLQGLLWPKAQLRLAKWEMYCWGLGCKSIARFNVEFFFYNALFFVSNEQLLLHPMRPDGDDDDEG